MPASNSLALSPALALLQALEGFVAKSVKIYIAYSGGLDSQVLLHLSAQLAQQQGFTVTALHLNHGLSPNSDQWQAFCKLQCEQLNIAFECKGVLLDIEAGNLEHRARQARYNWFESVLSENDILLSAHHQNDQAETFLLRALRASGSRGLAAIPLTRNLGKAIVIRPFLGLSKSQLQDYAHQHKLDWVEDESNQAVKFDRNFLRHNILPSIIKRWPNACQQFAKSARNCADDLSLLEDLAKLDFKAIKCSDARSVLDYFSPIHIPKLLALSKARQRNLLQYLLRAFTDYPIADNRLNEWLSQIQSHSSDLKSSLVLENIHLRLFYNKHYFLKPLSLLTQDELKWMPDQSLYLAKINCELKRVEQAQCLSDEAKLTLKNSDHLTVHFRQGGERVQLKAERFSRSFKKVLQEQKIPPWLRDNLPMVSFQGHIVWSACLGGFSPSLHNEKGQVISFEIQQREET